MYTYQCKECKGYQYSASETKEGEPCVYCGCKVELNRNEVDSITIKNQQQLRNETNMLDGNVSRMCLTNDKSELNSMFEWALHRLNEIYKYNLDRITRT